MVIYNTLGSEKVSYEVMSANGYVDVSTIPSLHKLEVENIGALTDGSIKSISLNVEIPEKVLKVTHGAAGALTSAYVNNESINLGDTLDASAASFGTGGLEITLVSPAPHGIIGAAVSIEFKDVADDMALKVPNVLYVTAATGSKISLGLEKFGGLTTSANVDKVRIISFSPIMRNLPVHITSVDVTNNNVVFTGSFPENSIGNGIVISSHSICVSKQFRNKGEGIEFAVKSKSANKLTVIDVGGKITSLAQSDAGTLIAAELVNILGHSVSPLNAGGLESSNLSIKITGGTVFPAGSNLKITQHIRSL